MDIHETTKQVSEVYEKLADVHNKTEVRDYQFSFQLGYALGTLSNLLQTIVKLKANATH